MSLNHLSHLVHLSKHGAEAIKTMKPLHAAKSPVWAFLIGILFGAPGIGIYFRSWKDFFICLVAFFALGLVLLPTVIGEAFVYPLAVLFCGIYGAWRADTSNGRIA